MLRQKDKSRLERENKNYLNIIILSSWDRIHNFRFQLDAILQRQDHLKFLLTHKIHTFFCEEKKN